MRDRRLAELTEPGALLALAVLVANDHFLKGGGLLPSWLTGKLSDFAGLFLFPVLAFVLASLVVPRFSRLGLATGIGVLTALGFVFVKLSPWVNARASAVFGPMALDATDLLALPMVVLAVASLARAPRAQPALGLRVAVTLASVIACIATSQPLSRGYPAWKLDDGRQRIGCARIEAWVSKSGKQGVGVNVLVESTSSDRCRVEILSGAIDVGGERVTLAERPGAETLGDVPVIWYLPFAFDNEKAWNDGRRTGTITLDVMTSGGRARLKTAMKHEWGPPHVWRRQFVPDAGSPLMPVPPKNQAYELEPKDAGASE